MKEIIYGPPGTGKTSEMMRQMRHYSDDTHLFCSFTRAAAHEGRRRAGDLPTIRTLHSLAYEKCGVHREQVMEGNRLLEFGEEIGIPMDEEFGLGQELLKLYQMAEGMLTGPDKAFDEVMPLNFGRETYRYFCESYRRWKDNNGIYDFNDMLKVFIKYHEHHVNTLLIDEAQDLSRLQWLAVDKIRANNIFVAGDDDQSIYEWSGADPRGMYNFAKANNIPQRVLINSHRVPVAMFNMAMGIVNRIRVRVPKEYLPNTHEGEIINYGSVDGVEFNPDKEYLFLYRNHSQRRHLEEYLINNSIPYKVRTGKRGLFDDKNARAYRAFIKAKRGMALTESEKLLLKVVTHEIMDSDPLDEAIAYAVENHWVPNIPDDSYAYLGGLSDDMILENDPKVTLSTIHAAKGMEADEVVLLNAMGAMTHENTVLNMDAECRVWYVAVTRAKEKLHIIDGERAFDL